MWMDCVLRAESSADVSLVDFYMEPQFTKNKQEKREIWAEASSLPVPYTPPEMSFHQVQTFIPTVSKKCQQRQKRQED